jgi:hypothetical protein
LPCSAFVLLLRGAGLGKAGYSNLFARVAPVFLKVLTGFVNVRLLYQIAESLTGRMELINLLSLSQGELKPLYERFLDGLYAASLPALKPGDDIDLEGAVLAVNYSEVVRRAEEK